VDPDGKTIRIARTGNWKKIRQYLISLIQRPSGRKHLATLAEAKDFDVVYRDTAITSRPKLRQIQESHQKAKVTFGSTHPVGVDGNYSGAIVNIDTYAVSQLHPDKSGVTITDHENYHAQDMLEQKPLAEVAKGDFPSSETGPAERQGRQTAAEQPTMSRKDAEKLLDRWLSQSAEKPVN
jgi:hypothetical protein